MRKREESIEFLKSHGHNPADFIILETLLDIRELLKKILEELNNE